MAEIHRISCKTMSITCFVVLFSEWYYDPKIEIQMFFILLIKIFFHSFNNLIICCTSLLIRVVCTILIYGPSKLHQLIFSRFFRAIPSEFSSIAGFPVFGLLCRPVSSSCDLVYLCWECLFLSLCVLVPPLPRLLLGKSAWVLVLCVVIGLLHVCVICVDTKLCLILMIN